MIDKKIERLILKDDDILVVTVPDTLFSRQEGKSIISIQKKLRQQLIPRKNKILILPDSIKLSVIGKEKIEEYVSHIDLWNLFDEEGDEIL